MIHKFYIFLIPILTLTACQKAPDFAAYAPNSSQQSAELVEFSPQSEIITQEENNPALKNRSLAISGEISFETDNVLKTNHEIENLTLKHGGYIQNSHIANQEGDTHTLFMGNNQKKQLITYYLHADVVVRIPKQNAAAFLSELSPLIEFLEYRNFLAEDVKLDIEKAQLQAQIQRETQTQLQETDTQTISQNALAKEKQLNARIQKKMLEDKVDFATITLKFHETAKVSQKIVPDIGNQIKQESNYTFFDQLKNSLATGWYYFLQFILFVSELWVFILVLCASVYAVNRWRKHRKKIKQTQAAQDKSP